MAGIPFYDGEAVKSVLTYEELVPVIEETLAKFSLSSLNHTNNVHQPLRATAAIEKFNG